MVAASLTVVAAVEAHPEADGPVRIPGHGDYADVAGQDGVVQVVADNSTFVHVAKESLHGRKGHKQDVKRPLLVG